MLRVNDGKGFAVTFANGVTVSVQFGAGNYCAAQGGLIGGERQKDLHASQDAEVAIFRERQDGWLTREFEDRGDDVLGWCDAETILRALNWAAAYGVADTGLAPALSA